MVNRTITKKGKDLKVGDIIRGRGIIYKIENNIMYFYSLFMNDINNYFQFKPDKTFEVEIDSNIILLVYDDLDQLFTRKIDKLVSDKNKLCSIRKKRIIPE